MRTGKPGGKTYCDCGKSGASRSRGDCGLVQGRGYGDSDPGGGSYICTAGGKEVCVVSQTTFNYNKFHYIVEIFQKKGYNVSVVNTICNATEERQRAARALAAEADVMIVIGGKHSSNTRKLYEICLEECAKHLFYTDTG